MNFTEINEQLSRAFSPERTLEMPAQFRRIIGLPPLSPGLSGLLRFK